MIKTATQLKAKVRNLSGSDSQKAQTLIRNYIMERFLERISLSPYRNNFILKGGMLVAAVVGVDTRATMDIDTTVKALNLSEENVVRIIKEIIAVAIPDGVHFTIMRVENIMEEHEYPGVRCVLDATLDNLHQTIKIDISTGDVITPGAVQYPFDLMFEDRAISLWTYSLETLLAEKLETIMARGPANTRMRDFYDIHVISRQKTIDTAILKDAFIATSEKRSTTNLIPDLMDILHVVEIDESMKRLWDNYREDSFFVGELSWEEVIASVKALAKSAMESRLCDELS